MSRKQPTIVFLFLHGTEVRQYIHAGVIPELAQNGVRVVVVARLNDDDLTSQLTGVSQVFELPSVRPLFFWELLRFSLDEANACREEGKGYVRWKYLPEGKEINWKGRVAAVLRAILINTFIHYPVTFRWASTLEQWYLKRVDIPEWQALLNDIQPNLIVTSVPKVANIEMGLAKAAQRNVRTALFFSTLKDVTAPTGRCNHNYDLIGVWNEWMREKFIHQNPHIDTAKIHLAGCTHFDTVGPSAPMLTREELCAMLGLDSDAEFILYTAANPKVVAHEESYIELIARAIQSGTLPSNINIVVRSNPMDREGVLASRVKYCERVIFTEPDWRWQPEINWCFQRRTDQRIYNALLHYAVANISIPSTVTVECAIAKLPVINIGFKLPNVATHHQSILDFWNADFYKLIRHYQAATLAETPETLIGSINALLKRRELLADAQDQFLGAYLAVNPGEATRAHIRLINEVVAVPAIPSG